MCNISALLNSVNNILLLVLLLLSILGIFHVSFNFIIFISSVTCWKLFSIGFEMAKWEGITGSIKQQVERSRVSSNSDTDFTHFKTFYSCLCGLSWETSFLKDSMDSNIMLGKFPRVPKKSWWDIGSPWEWEEGDLLMSRVNCSSDRGQRESRRRCRRPAKVSVFKRVKLKFHSNLL